MLENLRYRLACWLAPEFAAIQKRVEDIEADREAQGYTITKLRSDMETLEGRANTLADRAAAVALKLTVARTALRAALPYIQDAHDDLTKRVEATKPGSARRGPLLVTAQAVWADLVATLNAASSAENLL